MHQVRLGRAFVTLHLTLGFVVLIDSAVAFSGAIGLTGSHEINMHLAILAGVETIAAALFLLRATVRVGGIALLGVFAVAVLVHAAQGEFAAHLLVYVAGTLFVLVHAPVSVKQVSLSKTVA
jgi:hypothetical protein